MNETSEFGGAPPDGSGGPHCFVADLESPALTDADHHHLSRALRLAPGDPCTMGDGAGRWRPCAFGEAPEPVGPVVEVAPSAESFGVGFVVVKGERPERVVAGLTELGMDRIRVVVSDRSVVRWDAAKAERNIERLRRVVRESAMQSRQVYLPALDPLFTFADLLEGGQPELLLADPRAQGSLAADLIESPASGSDAPSGSAGRMVLVGPEGGWSEAERAAIAHHVRLPGRVLRAETAAIAAATVLASHRLESSARRG